MGKTAAAVEVARRVGGEIVSADSGAVYRGLDIGTAKPSEAERRGVCFHVLDVASPEEGFSAARFKACAEDALAGIRERGTWPIVCGGTGLYVRALLDGLSLTETPRDPAFRALLMHEAETEGVPALHARLASQDPAAAARIHVNDRVRIVRALEIMEHAGRPVSALYAEDADRRRALRSARFALTAPREELHRRIEARVDAMIASGLAAEVAALLACGAPSDAPGMKVLGYKEMVAHLSGACSLPDAVLLIKRNTRRYARRQLTWFRADRNLTWLDVTNLSPPEVADMIVGRL